MTDSATISDSYLKKLAGEKTFERGVDYYQAGNIVQLKINRATVTATVAGTSHYHVTLRITRQGVDGACDCPASEGVAFCKHCVAVALAYRNKKSGQSNASGSAEERVQAYIDTLSEPEVRRQLLNAVTSDTDLLQQWSLKADIALGGLDPKAIKKRITAALPYNRHLFRYPQVRSYFNKAESALGALAEELHHLPADKALTLIDYAVQRLARALNTIDDSGGFRFDLMQLLFELHQATVARLEWPAPQIASYLHTIGFGELSDFYPQVPSKYANVVKAEVYEAFYVILQQEWDNLPPLDEKDDWGRTFFYLRRQKALLERAKANDDFPSQVELLKKTAVTAPDFADLCDLCMTNNAWEQADYWLSRLKKTYGDTQPHRQDQEANRLQVRLYLHKNLRAQAQRLQRLILENTLELKDYIKLLELHDEHDVEQVRSGIRDYFKAQLGASENRGLDRAYTRALFTIYLHENDLNSALQLCQEHHVSSTQMLELARHFKDQPITALELYFNIVADTVASTNNRAYQHAVALLQEFEKTLKVPAHHMAFENLLGEIREHFKQKRNFMKYLNARFPPK